MLLILLFLKLVLGSPYPPDNLQSVRCLYLGIREMWELAEELQ